MIHPLSAFAPLISVEAKRRENYFPLRFQELVLQRGQSHKDLSRRKGAVMIQANKPIPCFESFRNRDRLVRLGNRLGRPIRIVCTQRNLRCGVLKQFDSLCIRPTGPSLKRRLGRHAHIVCSQCKCHKFLQHET